MLDLSGMRLTLVQIIEPSSTYAHVLALLDAVQPEHLLVVDSAQASCSGLNTATRALFTHVPVPRAFFDDTKVFWPCGTIIICQQAPTTRPTAKSLTMPATLTNSLCGSGSTCSPHATSQLALLAPCSSTCATVLHEPQQYKYRLSFARFASDEQRVAVAPGSLHVMLQQPEAYLELDTATLEGLQVVTNPSPECVPNMPHTLFKYADQPCVSVVAIPCCPGCSTAAAHVLDRECSKPTSCNPLPTCPPSSCGRQPWPSCWRVQGHCSPGCSLHLVPCPPHWTSTLYTASLQTVLPDHT